MTKKEPALIIRTADFAEVLALWVGGFHAYFENNAFAHSGPTAAASTAAALAFNSLGNEPPRFKLEASSGATYRHTPRVRTHTMTAEGEREVRQEALAWANQYLGDRLIDSSLENLGEGPKEFGRFVFVIWSRE